MDVDRYWKQNFLVLLKNAFRKPRKTRFWSFHMFNILQNDITEEVQELFGAWIFIRTIQIAAKSMIYEKLME